MSSTGQRKTIYGGIQGSATAAAAAAASRAEYRHPEMGQTRVVQVAEEAVLSPAPFVGKMVHFVGGGTVSGRHGQQRPRSFSMPTNTIRRKCAIADCGNTKVGRAYCVYHAAMYQSGSSASSVASEHTSAGLGAVGPRPSVMHAGVMAELTSSALKALQGGSSDSSPRLSGFRLVTPSSRGDGSVAESNLGGRRGSLTSPGGPGTAVPSRKISHAASANSNGSSVPGSPGGLGGRRATRYGEVIHVDEEYVKITKREYTDLLVARDAYRRTQEEREHKKREVTELRSQLVMMRWKTASMATDIGAEPFEHPPASPHTPIESIVKELLNIMSQLGDNEEHQDHLMQIVKSLTSPNAYEVQENTLKAAEDDMSREWLAAEFSGVRARRSTRRMSTMTVASNYDNSMWSFNVFIQDKTSLTASLEEMFTSFGLLEKFDINQETFRDFLSHVTMLYRDNPYHNFVHCVDVTQTTYYFLRRTNLVERMQLTDLDILALLLAAVCHDVDHPGLNNNFQINQQTPLALRYNDLSVLENHHCSKLFTLLKDPKFAILDGMPSDDRAAIRATIISLILSTDMSKHFGLLGKFRARFESGALEPCDEDRHLVMSLILHAADISNPAKPFLIAQHWATLVLNEFWAQGDIEKAASLPVSPMCERESCDKPKQQVDFIDYVVNPLFKAMSTLLTGLDEPLACLEHNRKEWKRLGREALPNRTDMSPMPRQSQPSDSNDTDGSRG